MVEAQERLLPSEYLERGWTKGVLTDGNNRYCMLGAILMWDTGQANWGQGLPPNSLEYAKALDLGQYGMGQNIAKWNNAPERTQAEVVARARMAEVKLGLRDPEPEVLETQRELVGVGD